MWKSRPQRIHKTDNQKISYILHRWCVLGVCWATYLLYRGIVIGQIKYDARRGKMIIHPRNWWTKKIALLVKIYLGSFHFFGVVYIIMALVPIMIYGKYEEYHLNIFENALLVLVCSLEIWKAVRLIYWLMSLSWNRSFVRFANEVISIGSLMEQLFPMGGTMLAEYCHLYFFLAIQFPMLLLEVYNSLTRDLSVTGLISVLVQIFFNAYAVYQLILLSWVETLNRFLESHTKDGIRSAKQCHRLIRLFHLYSRIAITHKDISKLWLPVSSILFSSVVAMMCFWAELLFFIVHDNSPNKKAKWYHIFNTQLGLCCMPFLRILFIGLCNDRLAHVENVLRLNLLVVDLNQLPCNHFSDTFTSNEIKNLQMCFDLQLHVQPLKNKVLSDYQVCGCEFVLEFCVCILLNALDLVQYHLDTNTNGLIL
ncbi:hypothetical protein KR018_012453 [Drosophila ironensis]|nr:hypothetical protein KR018_012453 [Drosophila ironensis]